jgi:ATP-dependent protease ClpP protease subunit
MLKKITVDPRIRAKRSELIAEPIIVHVQKFDEDAVKEFREQFEKALHSGQPVVPVLIDSYGGSVYGCLDMISYVKNSPIPVDTIVCGKAMSAGAILFGMGRNRYMAENATIMLHDASMMTGGKNEEIKSDAKELDRLNTLIFKLLAQNCGHKEDYFVKLLHDKGHADWFLTPKDAKKHKICTNIHVPELQVNVSLAYSFS